MKNRIANIFAMLVLAFASIGTANALPTVWVDSYDPADFLLTAPNSITFTQDITDHGYRPGIDSIYSAALFINVYDDLDIFSSEKISFNFDGSGWTPAANVNGNGWWTDTFAFDVTSLATDGLINVTVKATTGDFYFANSSLVVLGNQAAVPEPMSIAMFGIGLLALGMTMAMKRKQSKFGRSV